MTTNCAERMPQIFFSIVLLAVGCVGRAVCAADTTMTQWPIDKLGPKEADEDEASKMTLGQAKDVIQHAARWAMVGNAVNGGAGIAYEFGADRIEPHWY